MGRARALRLVGALAFGVALASVGSPPALADDATVGVRTAAWYTLAPACPVTAASCPDAPAATPSPYPAGTVHIAVSGGSETARTYLRLDLGRLPSDAPITGGTLRLPVATDAGTMSPETATFQACLSTEPFEPADGAASTPPAYSCGVSAVAKYAPADATNGATFTVDLDRFASRLRESTIGLALVPTVEALKAPTTWHVAFNAAARAGSDAKPITAVLSYEDASPASAVPARPASPRPAAVAGLAIGRPPLPVLPVPNAPSVATASGEVVSQLATPTLARTAVGRGAGGFEQPVVFAAPLVLLALASYMAWALTRPIRMDLV